MSEQPLPAGGGRVYITDFRPGQTVQGVFVLAEARQAQAKNGMFWALILQDRTGRLDAKVWSPLAQTVGQLAPGMVARLTGQTEVFRDQLQLNIQSLEILDPAAEELDITELVPSSEEHPADMLARLEELCRKNLHYPPWRKLAKKVLTNEAIRDRLLVATGAKAMHHAYVGGLLEHTLSVFQLCMGFSERYPQLDREILLLAAVLHDLGKAWELSTGFAMDYTDEGRLIGHIIIGLEKLEPFLRKSKADPELVTHLKHIIISHHGEYEFGSPRRPKTAEAMALHYADNLDAKMNQFAGAFPEAAAAEPPPEEGEEPLAEEPRWSPFQRSLGRFLFKPRPTPGNGRRAKTADKKEDQCSLPLKA